MLNEYVTGLSVVAGASLTTKLASGKRNGTPETSPLFAAWPFSVVLQPQASKAGTIQMFGFKAHHSVSDP